MQRVSWVWFAGCVVWVVDGAISVRLHAWQHAELAFLVALVFFAAGLLSRRSPR